MSLFAEMGKLRNLSPQSEEAMEAAGAVQAYITEHFYPCTDEIFAGLGQMYSADGRFRDSIDRAGGSGTAEFASRAIAAYLRRKAAKSE